MVSIAVIMTCFNRREKTLKCLDALHKQDGLQKEFLLTVYLVDDGSTDGTSEAVAESFPSVNIIQGTGSLYWNRGMHLAWQKASLDRFDYFFWLNDDTNLIESAVKVLLATAHITGNNAVICGATSDTSGDKFTYGGRNSKGEEIVPNGTIQDCHTINGNAVLVSNNIFNSVGNLDPIFPHAIGDVEYGLRAKKMGYAVVTPSIFIGHCSRNLMLPSWCYQSTPLKKRFKVLYSPLGNCHPYYFFIFERKYYGLAVAIKHYFSIHLRALIPALWNK